MASEIANATTAALATGHVPRVIMKQVRSHAYEIMRIYSLARLQERFQDVKQLDHELTGFRDYLMWQSGRLITSHQTHISLFFILKQAVQNLQSFSDSRNVQIILPSTQINEQIFANERDILRVVTNVLHNAIKYSWSRAHKSVWVDVNLYAKNKQVFLEIENFGVPIPKDEIDSGLIFEIGYRSRLSTDRGRVGTGFGLADAKSTLRKYKGTIQLESNPASPGGKAEKGDPFLTKAIITLPISTQQEGLLNEQLSQNPLDRG